MRVSPRRRAREFAVQALYQVALNKIPAPEVAQHIRESNDYRHADGELFTAIFFGAHNNQREYMQIIRPLLDRDENLINPIERSVLLVAVHELKAMPETPYPVINKRRCEEPKTFAAKDTHRFINAVWLKWGGQLRPNDPKRRDAA